MGEYDIWKYCTKEQVKECLVEFHLLDGIPVREEKAMACLYAVSNHTERHYREVRIPKKSGGFRVLHVPDRLLAGIQKNILHHILDASPCSEYATAYRKGISIADNAKPHVGKEKLLKLDIRDFFGSITYQLVYQYAFPAQYYPPPVRMMLAHLCCYRDCLPQGAPTSPAVSNLVMKAFDEYIGAWCRKREISYTRYCDDMTFSGAFDERELKYKVKNFLLRMGFELNEKKTRRAGQGSRQSVTGIVVNEKLQTGRDYRRKLRAEIYCYKKFQVRQDEGQEALQKLLGKVRYVLQVNPKDLYFRNAERELKEILEAERLTDS